MSYDLARRCLAEFLGTAFLLAGVVGSGIAATQLSDDHGLQLLQNAFATGAVLVALILALGSVSGAHLNPAVTLVDRWFGGVANREALGYLVAQLAGAVVGVCLANLMFDLPVVEISERARDGNSLLLGEGVATFGLLVVIFGVVRSGRIGAVAFAVGAYIAAAYYFASSTSFANPAVTIGRVFTDTFTGIAPGNVPAFLAVQLLGALLAAIVIRVLYPDIDAVADRIVVPHEHDAD